MPKEPKQGPNKGQEGKKTLLIVVSVLVVLIILFIAFIYRATPLNSVTSLITKLVPLPAAIVNNHALTYHDWQNKVIALENFHQKEKEINSSYAIPSISILKNHIAERMIKHELLRQAAAENNISVSPQEITSQVSHFAQKAGSLEELIKEINELYDWELEEFENEIILPLLITKKLSQKLVVNKDYNQEDLKEAESIYQSLLGPEADFDNIATRLSEDIASVQGGDLGYFSRGDLLPEIEKVAFELETGELSQPIQTEYGYHIIKLEERLLDDQGMTAQVRLKEILVRSSAVEDYMEDFKNNSNVIVLINI